LIKAPVQIIGYSLAKPGLVLIAEILESKSDFRISNPLLHSSYSFKFKSEVAACINIFMEVSNVM